LLPIYQVLSYTIFELVSGDMNKLLMLEAVMNNTGDKTGSFFICKFGTNCAHGRLFIFWECVVREERIGFMNCFSSFRKTNDCTTSILYI